MVVGVLGKSRTFWLFVALLLVTACVPSGCGLDKAGCDTFASLTGKDPAHCYQWIAVQNSDTDECGKVQSEDWAGTGQNPPQDKCYLMIAEKDVDPEPCANIRGGLNSYTPDECYQNVGAKGGNADQCGSLTGDAQLECRTGIARGQDSEGQTPNCGAGYLWQAGGLGGGSCVKDPNAKPANATAAAATAPATTTEGTTPTREGSVPVKPATGVQPTETVKPAETTKPMTSKPTETTKETAAAATVDPNKPGWEQAVDTVADITDKIDQAGQKLSDVKDQLENAVKDVFTSGPDKDKTPTPAEEKGTQLSDLINDVTDQDARSDIIKTFIKEREKRDDLTIKQQQDLLAEIKQQYEFNQQMDEQANTLKANTVDKLTEQVNKLVDEKTEQAKQGAWDWFKEKTYGWVQGRDPANAKYVETAKLAEERYNQAVEKYNDALDKYQAGKDYFDNAKKAYDEVKEVMDNVRRLQDKVNSGQISEDRARVLKGGVLLGKGLEHMTGYIPVFGDTASQVTAGTFQATMRFAEKRAERTTKLDKCIDDPDNCDPNGISAY